MQTPVEKLWGSAQKTLRGMLNPDIYTLWFASVRARTLAGDELTLEVPNSFCEVWLKDNYLGLLEDVVAQASGRLLRIRFIEAPVLAAKDSTSNSTPTAAEPPPESAPSATPTPANAPSPTPAAHPLTRDSGFNPNYTFDTFVVGTSNSFAHAAARAVAQTPGKSYNPLFVYGGTGLGKTHLLHAIGQHATQTKRSARVAYLTSERFTNEYIDAIQTSQLVRFRRKYRQTDILLIDDVQFLANKERIQEEFFHTFNALHEAHKQIVLTCDRPAGEIQNLEHRLVSRFEWGLVTDLQPPDAETRVAILRKKEQSLGVSLPREILEFLATRIRSNVRRLESALIRVASYAALTGRALCLSVVEDLLRELLHEEGRQVITIEIIQKRVAEHFDLRIADMTSRRRPENIAFPRQIAMYLARQLTDSSLSNIGEAFGGRDHGTVLHACRLVKDRMEIDPDVRQTVSYLERQLNR